MKRICSLILPLIVLCILNLNCAKEEEKLGKKAEEPEKAKVAQEIESETSAPSEEEKVYIHDFDTGAKPNRLGGDFGTYDKDPEDFSQSCTESFDPEIKHGRSGFSLRLDYDVDSPNPAYNGFWSKLNNFDASEYKNLIIWIKGDKETGYTEVVKVELKSNTQNRSIYYITDIADEWKRHIMPLDKISGTVDLSSLSEFIIVFEDRTVTSKEGTIWIDDIYFSK